MQAVLLLARPFTPKPRRTPHLYLCVVCLPVKKAAAWAGQSWRQDKRWRLAGRRAICVLAHRHAHRYAPHPRPAPPCLRARLAAGPLFDAGPTMDFYNLELKDTNVVDHNTHDYRKVHRYLG